MEIHLHHPDHDEHDTIEVETTVLIREVLTERDCDGHVVWIEEHDELIQLDETFEAAGIGHGHHVHHGPKPPDHKGTTVIVNGRKHFVVGRELCFDAVVELAYGEASSDTKIYTIRYRNGCRSAKGSLAAGRCIAICKGMIFNVSATDKS
jgi:hypothetical protein